MAGRIKHGLLYWLLWVAIGAMVTLASAVYADGDVIKPPPGTVPQEPKPPWVQMTYCPIHALEGYGYGG
jgi:hypothetical protein